MTTCWSLAVCSVLAMVGAAGGPTVAPAYPRREAKLRIGRPPSGRRVFSQRVDSAFAYFDHDTDCKPVGIWIVARLVDDGHCRDASYDMAASWGRMTVTGLGDQNVMRSEFGAVTAVNRSGFKSHCPGPSKLT